MRTHDKEIGRIIARAMSHEVSLYECASQVQVQLDAIRLEGHRAGMLRAAEIAGASGGIQTAKGTKQAIITAANNLKPEDLK